MVTPDRREHVEGGVAAVLYGAITSLLLRDVLFQSDRVLSADGHDVSAQYLPWSRLIARELGHGHVPLRNPHTSSRNR